jgi:hypothetical protein
MGTSRPLSHALSESKAAENITLVCVRISPASTVTLSDPLHGSISASSLFPQYFTTAMLIGAIHVSAALAAAIRVRAPKFEKQTDAPREK